MKPYFTVYTPSYNRSHLLQRAYDSLLLQEGEAFEWLVIDDGSSDDTEAKVAALAGAAPFPVRYVRQDNQGKHVATNRAVELAEGEMFVILDSDDWMTKGALKSIRTLWETIPEEQRDQFAGVGGLFVTPENKPCTKHFPEPHVDSNMIEMLTVHGVSGEISVATRTRVRKEFPFPENVGKFCMETLVWNRLAQTYKIRFANRVFQVKDYQDQGLTKSGMHSRMASAPAAYILRSREYLDIQGLSIPSRHRAIAMQIFITASLHAGVGLGQQFAETTHKLLWLSQLYKGIRNYRRHLKRLGG